MRNVALTLSDFSQNTNKIRVRILSTWNTYPFSNRITNLMCNDFRRTLYFRRKFIFLLLLLFVFLLLFWRYSVFIHILEKNIKIILSILQCISHKATYCSINKLFLYIQVNTWGRYMCSTPKKGEGRVYMLKGV